jgi:hypothetical protein
MALSMIGKSGEDWTTSASHDFGGLASILEDAESRRNWSLTVGTGRCHAPVNCVSVVHAVA